MSKEKTTSEIISGAIVSAFMIAVFVLGFFAVATSPLALHEKYILGAVWCFFIALYFSVSA